MISVSLNHHHPTAPSSTSRLNASSPSFSSHSLRLLHSLIMKSFFTSALAMAMGASATVIRLNPPAEPDLSLMPRQDASCENTATSRSCWGDYDIDTNYYKTFPDTGVTREYWLSVESGDCAPDGVQRTCMTFNGTVPGPTIFVSTILLLSSSGCDIC